MSVEDRLGIIGDYHQRSKEEWEQQRNDHPQQRFRACDRLQLPLRDLDNGWNGTFSMSALSTLLLASLAMRGVESNGLLLNPTQDVEATIIVDSRAYRYNSFDHALEKKATFAESVIDSLTATTCDGQIVDTTFAVGLSTIGCKDDRALRSWRYCEFELGRQTGAVFLAAQAMGWTATIANHLSDESREDIVGLNHTSVILVNTSNPPSVFEEKLCTCDHHASAEASKLALYRHDWGEMSFLESRAALPIDDATRKPETKKCPVRWQPPPPLDSWRHHATIARRRRTPTEFKSSVESSTFFDLLDTVDGPVVVDDSATLDSGSVHLALLVGEAVDIASGLYMFARGNEEILERYGNSSVERVRGRLYSIVVPADVNSLATELLCDSPNATSPPISVVVIGDFGPVFFGDESSKSEPAPWRYKMLFREAGIIAETLSIEAEKRSLAVTSHGCFKDDVDHAVLGLDVDHRYQALYHLGIGRPASSSSENSDVLDADPYQLTRGTRPTFQGEDERVYRRDEDERVEKWTLVARGDSDELVVTNLNDEEECRARNESRRNAEYRRQQYESDDVDYPFAYKAPDDFFATPPPSLLPTLR